MSSQPEAAATTLGCHYETLAIERIGAVETIRLGRPDKLNAFDGQMVSELTSAFRILDKDPAVRVVRLTSDGVGYFCAGADLSWMKAAGAAPWEENVADAEKVWDFFEAIATCSKPVVAEVDGIALGGGSALIAACDITIATDRSQFSFGETPYGLTPAIASVYIVPRIGDRDARELFLTGERFDPQRAKDIGLVTRVVTPETLRQEADAVIAKLQHPGQEGQGHAKKLLHELRRGNDPRLRAFTVELIAKCRASDEAQELLRRFIEEGYRA